MTFVKVRHPVRGEAEITLAEVAQYRSMGFDPVDGSAVESVATGEMAPAANDPPQSATSGTDQRLDLVIDELRGMRADLTQRLDRFADDFAAFRGEWLSPEPLSVEPDDGETVELRGAGEPPTTAEAVLAANPNLTGASDVKDAHGNVIAQARGGKPPTTSTTAAPTTSTTTTPEPTTSGTTTKEPKR